MFCEFVQAPEPRPGIRGRAGAAAAEWVRFGKTTIRRGFSCLFNSGSIVLDVGKDPSI